MKSSHAGKLEEKPALTLMSVCSAQTLRSSVLLLLRLFANHKRSLWSSVVAVLATGAQRALARAYSVALTSLNAAAHSSPPPHATTISRGWNAIVVWYVSWSGSETAARLLAAWTGLPDDVTG